MTSLKEGFGAGVCCSTGSEPGEVGLPNDPQPSVGLGQKGRVWKGAGSLQVDFEILTYSEELDMISATQYWPQKEAALIMKAALSRLGTLG